MDHNDFTVNIDQDKKLGTRCEEEIRHDLTKNILREVCECLKEKGYKPIEQLVGYLISGDPTYITNHKGARTLIKKLERDEILEEVLKVYLK